MSDGLIQNSRSKAHLLTAVHQICGIVEEASYFPAYELIMDDLRDYRFYKADLIHPNDIAIEYIWQHFCETYFDHQTTQLTMQLEKFQKSLNHRAFNNKSEEHQIMLKDLRRKMLDFQKKNHVSLKEELDVLNAEIISPN